MSDKLLRLINMMLKGLKSVGIMHEEMTNKIETSRGVREGDGAALSAMGFIVKLFKPLI